MESRKVRVRDVKDVIWVKDAARIQNDLKILLYSILEPVGPSALNERLIISH